MSKSLTVKQKNQVKRFLRELPNLFAVSDKELKKTGIIKQIQTKTNAPIRQPQRMILIGMKR